MGLSRSLTFHTVPTVTGNANFAHGLGETPKVIIIFGAQEDGNTAYAQLQIGAGISSTKRFSASFGNHNGSAATDSARRFTTTRVLDMQDKTSGAFDYSVDLVSMDSTNVVLNVVTAAGSAGFKFAILALGGADLEVDVGTFDTGAVTGNLAVTHAAVAGTKAVLFVTTASLTPTSTADARFGWGVALSSTLRRAVGFSSDDGITDTDTGGTFKTDKCVSVPNFDGATVHTELDFVSFDSSTQFTVNRTTITTDVTIGYIVLGGLAQFDLQTITQPGATGNQALTTGFLPEFELFGGWGKASSGISVDAHMNTGVAVSSTSRVAAATHEDDAATTAVAVGNRSEARCIANISGTSSPPTLESAADFVSQDASGYTINWSTVDATARTQWALAVGAAEAASSGNARYNERVFKLGGVLGGIRIG
jgi:hypothetical protein